jgi:hypothetical protein
VHPMERAKLVVLAVVATVAVAWANLYAALYVGNTRCGDQRHPQPEPGSARSGYCEFFEDPDNRVTFLLGLLVYAPVLIVLLGAAWAIARSDGRPMARSAVAAIVWLLVFVLPSIVLPAS